MIHFSAKQRQQIIAAISGTSFDLLVIGGGITGAGIALDASARGLCVALIDMQDFAAGTSGRSTKLIHGGLRYLKQLEFKLVAEVGQEREIIHRIAPHLTRPETMLMPLTTQGSLGKLSTRLGMWLYERLAGVKKEERHRMLSATEALQAEPLLRKEDLLGGVLFYEYRTDDARLTIEVLKVAVAKGTVALNYMKATGFTYSNGSINGVRAEDSFTGTTHVISARYVVNASGPWVDELDELDKKTQGNKLNITKGIHIVVDQKKLPVKQSLYVDTQDKRMIFMIPREGKTYIGTTDTFYKGDKIHPLNTSEDKAYLLTCVNSYFPQQQITTRDIESGWAGLRPLINKPGKGPSEISRRDEIFVWDSGLITIAGGKLTGYRKMAQRVVDLIASKIKADTGKMLPECGTQHIYLANGNGGDFRECVKGKMEEGLALGLSAAEAELLIYRFGGNVEKIYRLMSQLRTSYTGKLPLSLYTQLVYTVELEACTTPADFFIRRTAALYFDIQLVRQWKEEVIRDMQQLLGWDAAFTAKLAGELEAALQEF